jgi:hypothetical protein
MVVVRRLGKVLGKGKVPTWQSTVEVPIDTRGFDLPKGSESIKVKVAFQGTKTVKRD